MKNDNLEKPDPLLIKLNTIIRLLLTKDYMDENNTLKVGETANFLYSCGWVPAEIAKFLGKKDATKISYVLYSKGKKSSTSKLKNQSK